MYRYGWKKVQGRDGQPKQVVAAFKTDAAGTYQGDVRLIMRAARPSAFRPEGQIIVAYQFRLKRDTDCDNVMKAMNDAIAKELGVNDSRFLPVALEKTTGHADPHVVVYVFDAAAWRPIVEAR